MANPNPRTDQLDPVRSTKEATKRGRNGGIASGKARRKKRDLKAKARAMLETSIPKEKAVNLKSLGVDENDADWDDVILAALVKKAAKGNVMAIQALYGITGDDQYLKVKQSEARTKAGELKERKREFDLELAEKQRQFDLGREDRLKAQEKADDNAANWYAEILKDDESEEA